MFCSIIIPTIGRASLAAAVQSSLNQNFPDDEYEIIVVNDSGKPLPAAEWHHLKQVKIITTQKRERCFARNVGAATALGNYFCFLDDDDWLLPNALENFWSAAQHSPEAGWIYGTTQFVSSDGEILGELNQGKTGNCFIEAMTETWIPIQASLIRSDAFFKANGFDPNYIVTQDLHLLRNIALHHDLISIPANVACIHRGQKRTTTSKYAISWYYIALGREQLLQEKEAFARLIDSADNAPFLNGLLLRNYLITFLFNIRQRNWLNAIRRCFSSIRAFFKTVPYTFSKDYWAAVRLSRPLFVDIIQNPSPNYDSVEEWIYE